MEQTVTNGGGDTRMLSPAVRHLLGIGACLLMLSSGCLSIHRDVSCCDDPCLSGGVHVEVLRGISGYWPGADRFQEQLACRGVSSTVSFCEMYPLVADRLIEQKQRDPQMPIVVVGYSLGANFALRLARRLQSAGVVVDRLVLLETTYVNTIPSNVRSCFNLYKSRPLDEIPFMRGIPLEADHPRTLMTNYNCTDHDDGRYAGLNHLTLCNDDNVQALLADAVAHACGTAAFSTWQPTTHVVASPATDPPGFARVSDW